MVDIRAEQIGAIYAKQRKDGLASWTISGTNTILSAVFSFALSRGYIASNPLHRLDKIEKPKQVSEKEARRLSEQEVQAICDAAIDTYRPIVTTLAWTGVRVSEALGLRWQDIDFEEKEILSAANSMSRGVTRSQRRRLACGTSPCCPSWSKSYVSTVRGSSRLGEQLPRSSSSPRSSGSHSIGTTCGSVDSRPRRRRQESWSMEAQA